MKVLTEKELKQQFEDLPPVRAGREEFEDEDKWRWIERRMEIRNHIRRNEIDSFLRWSTLRATMFPGDSSWIRTEWSEIMGYYDDKRYNALMDSPLGNPVLIRGNKISGPSIHQAFHLMKWETHFKKKITDVERIVEFGGGYGLLCSIIHRMGYQGEYYIYDLPEMSLLQEFYLTNQGIDINYKVVDDLNRFPIPPDDIDVMFAFNSLNEVRSGLRKAFIGTARASTSILCVAAGAQTTSDSLVLCANLVKDNQDHHWDFERSSSKRDQWYIYGKY